jgi:F0F1-type ATP synthase delta subunit
MMNFNLPDSVIRYREAKRIHRQLQSLVQQAEGEQSWARASEEVRSLAQLNQQVVQQEGPARLAESLYEVMQNAPVFGVILTAHPHDSFVVEIGNWFRREIHPHSLLTISVRRSISGGAVIRSKNRIFDLSFRSQILENKDRISEVARRV